MRRGEEAMGNLRTVEHAAASLWLGLAMGATTAVHHLHAALVMRSTGPGLHVVWTEAVLMPVAAVSLVRFVRTGDRTALWVHVLVAALGLLGLGLYEGLWNHGAKVVGHLRIGCPAACVGEVLPPDDPHAWFHEVTGIATGALAFLSAGAAWRLLRGPEARSALRGGPARTRDSRPDRGRRAPRGPSL